MNNDGRDDMHDTTDGRGSLRGRLPQLDPPPELAQRVRATLESRGLVRQPVDARDGGPPSPRRRAMRAALSPLLVAAGFVLGLGVRGALEPTSAVRADSAAAGRYVLLLYGDPPDDTGAVHVAREREYGRWASALDGGARWVGGHELADVIDDLGPRGPASPAAGERLAGYFVIDAPTRERAAEVARTCPHLKYGGRVVVVAIAS